MTSKISFSKLIKEDIKKRAWLLLLSITIFIIIIPVLTAIKIEGALPGGVSSSSETWRVHNSSAVHHCDPVTHR